MPKYRVYAVVKGSKYIGTFEAKNKPHVLEKAWESQSAHVHFCHHCSHQCEDPECSEMIVELAENDAEVDDGKES